METEANVVPGVHVEHDDCAYFAPVFRIEGCGDFWFCNKCGQGDEVFPASLSDSSSTEVDR